MAIARVVKAMGELCLYVGAARLRKPAYGALCRAMTPSSPRISSTIPPARVFRTQTNRNHLARLSVIAEAGRIGHADEFIVDDIASHLQRLGHDRAQGIRVGMVADHDEFAILELVGPARIGEVVQRHCERILADIGKLRLHLLTSYRSSQK
jgi:hypothetical protein